MKSSIRYLKISRKSEFLFQDGGHFSRKGFRFDLEKLLAVRIPRIPISHLSKIIHAPKDNFVTFLIMGLTRGDISWKININQKSWVGGAFN